MSNTQQEEYSIIGCLLLDSDCLGKVYDNLKVEMFTERLPQRAYSAICMLYEIGSDINLVSVINKLEDYEHTRESIGQFLKHCLDLVDTSSMIVQFADVVINNYRIAMTKNYIGELKLFPDTVNDQVGCLINNLEQLMENKVVKLDSKATVAKDNKNNYFVEDKKKYIKSGFKRLDNLIYGFEGGDVCVIGARPGNGKSALANQMINNIAGAGYKVCYYNLEMMPAQLYERDVAQQSSITLNRLKEATSFADDAEKAEYERVVKKIESLGVDVVNGNVSLTQLKSICKHRNYDIVFVDYLQLVTSGKEYQSRVNEVGAILRFIKILSIELNIPFVVLSQLNRDCEQRQSKEPSCRDLRESGNIEQDASIVLLIWDLIDSGEIKGIKVDKSRQGAKGKIAFNFYGDHLYFKEIDEDFKKVSERIEAYREVDVDKLENPFLKGCYAK